VGKSGLKTPLSERVSQLLAITGDTTTPLSLKVAFTPPFEV
jgi:hypothetical protein